MARNAVAVCGDAAAAANILKLWPRCNGRVASG
jgi:hypothetical protein